MLGGPREESLVLGTNHRAARLNALLVSAVSLVMTIAGHRYGAAELPHTAACLTLILPMAGLGWLLRNPLPAGCAFVIVAAIQLSL